MEKLSTKNLMMPLLIASLMMLFNATVSHASTSYVVLNNYPADGKCEVGKNYDDGDFVYFCHKGCLEATYCIAFNDDGGTDVAMEVNEKIGYDGSATLRCEKSKSDDKLYQVLEDVASETIATSQDGVCPK